MIDSPLSTPCQAVQELLPWYANGTLQGAELDLVMRHLAACTGCQQELALWRATAALVHAVPEALSELPAPGPSYARLMAHIDAMETDVPWWEKLRAALAQYARTLWEAPGALRWTLALSSLGLLLMAGTLVRTLPFFQGTTYRTLSEAPTITASAQTMVRLVFAEDIPESAIRALLTRVQGSIIQGPSRLGVYTIILEKTPEVANTVEQRLALLRAHPQVRLAEPVPTPSS